MKSIRVIAPAFIVAAAVGGFAFAQGMPASVKVTNGILTDAKGMTLYTWDKDKEANKSACEGNCIMNWPALMANGNDKDAGDWKIISPLRRFEADRLQGQAALLLRHGQGAWRSGRRRQRHGLARRQAVTAASFEGSNQGCRGDPSRHPFFHPHTVVMPR